MEGSVEVADTLEDMVKVLITFSPCIDA
jgi:hypothetical protein